jgi:hypothetical protein
MHCGMLAAGGAIVLRAACRQMSGIFHRLEMRKLTTAGYPKNYVAIARRR